MIAEFRETARSFGGQEVFTDVSGAIHEDDRIGLVGPNGTGKSTLLRVLLGELEPDAGSVFLRKDARIGYLEQNSGLEAERSIMEEMRSVFAAALRAQERMDVLAEEIEKNPEDLSLQKDYDAQMAVFLASDGYQIDVKIRRILAGMGFGKVSESTLISTMSGGEKTRLALAKLLLDEPELLILDEPTNHLDMETLAWLEEYLQEYKGAVLVVSHDRFFLDRVVKSVWDLEDGRLETYPGNYTKYKALKKERLALKAKAWEKQRNQMLSLQEYIDKNSVRASTAQLARSRGKQLEKMEVLEKPRLHRRPPHFSFRPGRRSAQEVIEVENLDLTVGEDHTAIVRGIGLTVRRGEHLAVIGPNGTGKSTFLTTLLRSLKTGRKEILWGKGVSIGYYDQENRGLDAGQPAYLELIHHVPGLPESDARSLLGAVRLTGDDAFKLVGQLSGGERARLGLAVLMGRDANLLILDEPTNHLDLESREALEEALKSYEGTLIFVSHDRYFINALADRIMAVEDGSSRLYEGSYEDYLAAKALAPVRAERPEQEQKQAVSVKAVRRKQAERRQALYQVQQEISRLEKEMAQLHDVISGSSSDYEVLQETCARLEDVTAQHEEALLRWLELEEAGDS